MKKDILLNGVVVGSHEATGDTVKDAEAVQEILKQKGLYKEVTINDAMYGQANSFAEVANTIYNNDLKKSPFKGGSTAPFVVNAVFSIELYLKTIHHAYGNKARGHHLANLYKGMPKKGKAHFLKASDDIRHLYKLEIGSDIHTCLDSLNKAFEEWRYLYEHNRIGIELQSIRYTMHVSHEACCRVREDVNKT
ncbi:MAG: hypothetical protein ACRBB4_00395 [Neptuniibacter sp.]